VLAIFEQSRAEAGSNGAQLNQTIGFIGAGKMSEAFIAGLINNGTTTGQ